MEASKRGRAYETRRGGEEENDGRSSRGPKANDEGSGVDMSTEAPFCHRCDTLRRYKFQHLSVHNRCCRTKYSHFMRV
jgi:hypothetical protein